MPGRDWQREGKERTDPNSPTSWSLPLSGNPTSARPAKQEDALDGEANVAVAANHPCSLHLKRMTLRARDGVIAGADRLHVDHIKWGWE